MQFTRPEILYFLFLLVIPIIVHLFQLRRFKKVYFTNVKLLQQLQQNTRKSSQIKKWLLLISRLLLLALLILAFAQPFFKAKDFSNKNNELVVLLDNSFSMEAKGSKGPLLKRSIQELLENLTEGKTFSLLTNQQNFWDVDIKSIQKELQQLPYSPLSFEPDYLINQVKSKKNNQKIDYVFITDGLNQKSDQLAQIAKENTVYYIQPKAVHKNNISIEQLEITKVLENFYEITLTLKSYSVDEKTITIGVYDQDETIAKSQLVMDKETKTLTLNIPKKALQGSIHIEDGGLPYDNTYYFSITETKKPAVLIIGEPEKNRFINKILTSEEFKIQESTLKQLNYSTLEQQQLIVLNEIDELPSSLITNLELFYNQGGTLLIIPNENTPLATTNQLLKSIQLPEFKQKNQKEILLTEIAFNHPLFQNVFENKIDHFQYPKIQSYFECQKGQYFGILNYQNQEPFLLSSKKNLGQAYLFTAPLNKKNTNFQNSPLIVPVIYKIAQANETTKNNTFLIGENQNHTIDIVLAKDEVVQISNEKNSFIPQQQIIEKKVKLYFGDLPETAGNFHIRQGENNLESISFNYVRTESNIQQPPSSIYDLCTQAQNLNEILNTLYTSRNDTSLWKWFVIGAIIMALIEILIQKFVK